MNIEKKEWLKLHWSVLDYVCKDQQLPPYMIYHNWEHINYQTSISCIYYVKQIMRHYSTLSLRQQNFQMIAAAMYGSAEWDPSEYNRFLSDTNTNSNSYLINNITKGN